MIDVDQKKLLELIRALPSDDQYDLAAVFDADHTIWAGDLGDDAFKKALREERFKPESGPALAKLLEASGEASTGDRHRDAARIHARYKEGKVSERDIIATELVCYAGWTVAEVRALSREIMTEGLEQYFHEEVEPIIRELEAEHYRIHVVSGSPHWLVQEAVEDLKIHADHVLGARVKLDGDVLTDELDEPITFWEGKLDAIRTWLHERKPKVVFGDSEGDLAMLVAAQLPVAVNPRPGLQKKLDQMRAGQWCHYMPKRTSGGHDVKAHDTDRIIV